MITFAAIQIIQRNMSVGDDGSLVCKSIITVDVIEWLNSDGEVIASETGADELTLTFAPVNVSINNKKYTCRVNKSASLNGTVVVLVNGKLFIVYTHGLMTCFTLSYSDYFSLGKYYWPQHDTIHWSKGQY